MYSYILEAFELRLFKQGDITYINECRIRESSTTILLMTTWLQNSVLYQEYTAQTILGGYLARDVT